MQHFQKNMLSQTNERLLFWWYDQSINTLLKLYYWPAFVAGTSDNIIDLFKPQTYNICRI